MAPRAGDKQEQGRLFDIGFKAGRRFVEALQNGQISPEAMRSEVPIGVTMLLAGPSVDFVIGRIFENAMGDAFDSIVKRKDGMLMPVDDWVQDQEGRKSIAQRNISKAIADSFSNRRASAPRPECDEAITKSRRQRRFDPARR
jgi:hypothetical protein